MKERLITLVAVALLIVPLASGCRSREKAQGGGVDDTATIAPAEGKPSPTGNDAMTQTVDVENGRSENEGGAITDPSLDTVAPTSTAPAATETTATTPPVPRNRTQ